MESCNSQLHREELIDVKVEPTDINELDVSCLIDNLVRHDSEDVESQQGNAVGLGSSQGSTTCADRGIKQESDDADSSCDMKLEVDLIQEVPLESRQIKEEADASLPALKSDPDELDIGESLTPLGDRTGPVLKAEAVLLAKKPESRKKFNKKTTESNINFARPYNAVKPHICPVCGYAFIRKYHLTRHVRTHNKEKRYKCDLCNYETDKKILLRQHMSIHSTATPYKCDGCESGFRTKRDLKQHAKVHNTFRPFKCKRCDFECSVQYDLKKHKRIHKELYLFKCVVCEDAFYKRTHLMRHLKLHEGYEQIKSN